MIYVLIFYILYNTVCWIKSNEPYSFKVHFFFIAYLFSNEKSFSLWYDYQINKIKSALFQESYELNNYIIRTLYNNYRDIFINYQIYDIKIRRKDGFKVYLYGYSNETLDVYNMEIELFERLHTKIEIIYIQQTFFK